MSNGNIADFARSVRAFSDSATALSGNQGSAHLGVDGRLGADIVAGLAVS